MIISLLRQLVCIGMSLLLFVACNQSRHIVDTTASLKDHRYSQELKRKQEARKIKIEKIQDTAKSLLGTSYKIGSTGPKSFDCSGFTNYLFKKIELRLPRKASDQAQIGSPVQMDLVEAGDLLFFGHKRIHHVAMVSKVKRGVVYITHATTSRGVVEEKLKSSEYWSAKFKVARRVIT